MNEKIPGSLYSFPVYPVQHKYYIDNVGENTDECFLLIDKVDDNTDDWFLLINKCYWTVKALQTNKNYTFSFKYQILHILLFISSRSWYEFHTETLKHVI
jgi:hypothetical protein